MLATDTIETHTVQCPRCGRPFNLPLIKSFHSTPEGEAFVRVRLDHTDIDAHISGEHGVPLA